MHVESIDSSRTHVDTSGDASAQESIAGRVIRINRPCQRTTRILVELPDVPDDSEEVELST